MTNKKQKNISRRQFVAVAGGGMVGMAAAASMGVYSGWGQNQPEIASNEIKSSEHTIDVLVIGGGMAGLFAAVKSHDAGAKVMLVSKGRLGSSGLTPFAKGFFVFDASKEKISIDEFVDSVSKSALGTNNKAYTRQLAEHSLARANELREWGFFDSPLYNNSFSQPINERNIPMMERIVITHLIKDDGRISGAAGFSIDEPKMHIFNAKSVILCTGSGGFKPNGFPICDLTHDGTIMAYNIGAKVTGKEWNDGHLGKAKNAAACYDGWGDMFERKPSTGGVEVHHDLGMEMNYVAYMKGNPIENIPPDAGGNTDLTGGPFRPAEFNRSARPEGERPLPPESDRPDNERPRPPRDESSKEGGAPGPSGMRGTPVGGSSAGMAIHKSEGIVPINDICESNIPGLYAAGDALGSYMAGAIYTQVGSSLAGSAVQGSVAGKAAAEHSKSIDQPVISKASMDKIHNEIFAPLKRESGYSPAWVTQTLQGIVIPNFVLYIKKESMLKAALAYVEELRDHHLPLLRAADLHELRLAHETTNMIISAEMKLKASIMRTESRCSHYRLDYPETDDENWRAWIHIFKGADGTMQFEKQPFETVA